MTSLTTTKIFSWGLKQKIMNRRKKEMIEKTLLIDGNYLLKRSFYIKDNLKEQRTYAFISTIRKLINQFSFTKVVVFWDSDDSGILKKEIIENYKANRFGKTWCKLVLTEQEALYKSQEYESVFKMKLNIKNYLEHLFIRQSECPQVEGDDLIAYYCSIAENEDITIFSNDRDLLQLLQYNNTSVIMANKTITIDDGDYDRQEYILLTSKNYSKYFDIHYENILLTKTICGDSSDNIFGINRLTENRLKKDFPKIKDSKLTFEEIKSYYSIIDDNILPFCFRNLLDTENYKLISDFPVEITDNILIINDLKIEIINKKIKDGVYTFGDILKKCKYSENKFNFISDAMKYLLKNKVYNIIDLSDQRKIIDLINPIMTELSKEECFDMYNECMSPEDRGGKYLIQHMYTDNFLDNFRFIRWEDKNINNAVYRNIFKMYCQPFFNIIKNEKEKHEQQF